MRAKTKRPAKCCWNCLHSKWQLTTNGRRRSDYTGECTYVIPVLPASMQNFVTDAMPSKHSIYAEFGTDCQCFRKEDA